MSTFFLNFGVLSMVTMVQWLRHSSLHAWDPEFEEKRNKRKRRNRRIIRKIRRGRRR